MTAVRKCSVVTCPWNAPKGDYVCGPHAYYFRVTLANDFYRNHPCPPDPFGVSITSLPTYAARVLYWQEEGSKWNTPCSLGMARDLAADDANRGECLAMTNQERKQQEATA